MARRSPRTPPPEPLHAARQEAHAARRRLERRHPLWPAEATVSVAILLGLGLPDSLTIGGRWVIPACEAALLVGLIATSPRAPERESDARRGVRIALIGLVSAVNVVALFLLAESLLAGGAGADGKALLIGGANLWITAVLLFAVWFWELDRGGPVRRLTLTDEDERVDFLFPQMTGDVNAPDDWRPGLGDYLYLSLNNASSFSPAETIPLSGQAKVLMSAQTLASLTTMTLVLSYAINNLG